jgi:hypothetical protein
MSLKNVLWKLCGLLGASALVWAFYDMALAGLKRAHVLAALGFFVVCLLFAAIYGATWVTKIGGKRLDEN